jgi:hypothetical protein
VCEGKFIYRDQYSAWWYVVHSAHLFVAPIRITSQYLRAGFHNGGRKHCDRVTVEVSHFLRETCECLCERYLHRYHLVDGIQVQKVAGISQQMYRSGLITTLGAYLPGGHSTDGKFGGPFASE